MKKILVVSEFFEDGASRYAGLVAEIRRCFPGCQLFALFYLPGKCLDRVVDNALFDDVSSFRTTHEAWIRGSAVKADLLICLVNHNVSIIDVAIYRASLKISAVERIFTYRSIPLLHSDLRNGVSHESKIRQELRGALLWWVEVHLKVLLFTCLVMLARPFLTKIKKDSMYTQVHSILAIKLDVLGDMIVSIPYLLHLKRFFPGAHLTVLASSRGASILKEQKTLLPDLFDELIVWDTPWHFKKKLLGVIDLLTIIKKLPGLRRKQYDLVLQPVPLGVGTALAVLISGKKVFAVINPELPLSRLMERFVSNPLHIDPKRVFHMEDFSRMIAENLGMGVTMRERLAYSDVDTAKVAEAVGFYDGLATVVFNVGAGERVREWGVENFAKLAEMVVRDGRKVVLIGSGGDRATASAILALAPDVLIVDAVGSFSLNEVAALMAVSAAIVTADTGIMHLAAAMRIKIVAIFGAGLIPFCHPLTDDYVIIQHELGCSGCGDCCFIEGRPPCLELVTVEEVYVALVSQLSIIGYN